MRSFNFNFQANYLFANSYNLIYLVIFTQPGVIISQEVPKRGRAITQTSAKDELLAKYYMLSPLFKKVFFFGF